MNPTGRIAAVERACTDLRREGQPVTVTAIAAVTGISRTTLHRHTDIRAVIDEPRHRDVHDPPLAGITDELATLRTVVTELAERVRNHEEQLRRLN